MIIYLKFQHASLHEVNHQEAHMNLFHSTFLHHRTYHSNHKIMLNKWFSHIALSQVSSEVK